MAVYTALMTSQEAGVVTLAVVPGDLINASFEPRNAENVNYIEERVARLQAQGKALTAIYDRSTSLAFCAENDAVERCLRSVRNSEFIAWYMRIGTAMTFTI